MDPRGFEGVSRDLVEGGWTINRSYFDMSGTTWADVADALELEEAIIEAADAASTSWESFEQAVDDAEDELDDVERAETLWGLDTGVAAATMSLNAAGMYTGYSCRGHPVSRRYNGGSDHACVLTLLDQPRWSLLEPLLHEAGCGAVDTSDGVLIYGRDVRALMKLAQCLFDRSGEFDRLPPMPVDDGLDGSGASEELHIEVLGQLGLLEGRDGFA